MVFRSHIDELPQVSTPQNYYLYVLISVTGHYAVAPSQYVEGEPHFVPGVSRAPTRRRSPSSKSELVPSNSVLIAS